MTKLCIKKYHRYVGTKNFATRNKRFSTWIIHIPLFDNSIPVDVEFLKTSLVFFFHYFAPTVQIFYFLCSVELFNLSSLTWLSQFISTIVMEFFPSLNTCQQVRRCEGNVPGCWLYLLFGYQVIRFRVRCFHEFAIRK